MSGGGTTIITTTTTSCQKRNSRFKRFLNRHCHLVDFLSASATICLCLLILLPRVHESFEHEHEHEQEAHPGHLASLPVEPLPESAPNSSQLGASEEEEEAHEDGEGVHAHAHHHFPAGEVLICIGFFVFYCVGLGLARPQVTGAQQQQLYSARRRRKQSTSCCTSSRCPPQSGEPGARTGVAPRESAMVQHDELTSILSADESSLQRQADNDCLMLLNRHHQHHTHSKHHEHTPADTGNGNNNLTPAANRQLKQRRLNYGSTQTAATYNGQQRMQDDCVSTTTPSRGSGTLIVVDEIRITSGPELQRDQWPHSLRMLLFTIALALVLIFFDMNVLGMIRAVKVFRATSTGALLYVAFFIMLPQKPANCNSCKEEQEDEDGIGRGDENEGSK